MFSYRFQLNILAVIVAEILAITLTSNEAEMFADFTSTLLAGISSPVTNQE